jgi:hypothetical protein
VTDLTLLGGLVDLEVAEALISSPALVHVRRLGIVPFPSTRRIAEALERHFGTRLQRIS